MVNANGGKMILIVDNDESVLVALEDFFGAAGFTTRATWSGHEALSLIRSGKFSALLTDTYLADIHLAEFLGRLNRIPAKPPVVVMQNGVPTRTNRRIYDSLGVAAVVDKASAEHVRDVVALCCMPTPILKVTVH